MELSFISIDTVGKLAKKLRDISNKRAQEINNIADTFGDPRYLASLYVQPQCQHHNPADLVEDDNTSNIQMDAFLFINKYLTSKPADRDGANQLFVLSDAGMGKTSLLVMIKMMHLCSFWPSRLNCTLLQLGSKTKSDLAAIENKSSTVLLLDALDEDPESFGNVAERVLSILMATENFHRVIISCRTQFFPTGDADPFNRLGRLVIGGYLCPVIYLSFFEDAQVDEYLKKKFPNTPEQRSKAKALLSKMDSLRFRPLLLSYIDTLLTSNETDWNQLTVYQALVKSWLGREQRKIRKSREKDRWTEADLMNCCIHLAVHMQTQEVREISKIDLLTLIVSDDAMKAMTLFDIGGRSLLNRNSYGNYRFSHYSIQEFLIAIGLVESRLPKDHRSIRCTSNILDFLRHRSANVNYTGMTFVETNISDIKFSNSNFEHCEMDACSFKACDINNGRFKAAKLISAAFTACRIDHTQFAESNLRKSTFRDCTIIGSNFNRTNFRSAYFEEIKIATSTGTGVEANDIKISGGEIHDVAFDEIVLTGASIDKASIITANLSSSTLNQLSISNSRIRTTDISKSAANSLLVSRSDLIEVDLRNAKWTRCKIEQSSLSACLLENTIFTGTKFDDVTFSNMTINKVNFFECSFENVTFTECIFVSCIFTKATSVHLRVINSEFKSCLGIEGLLRKLDTTRETLA